MVPLQSGHVWEWGLCEIWFLCHQSLASRKLNVWYTISEGACEKMGFWNMCLFKQRFTNIYQVCRFAPAMWQLLIVGVELVWNGCWTFSVGTGRDKTKEQSQNVLSNKKDREGCHHRNYVQYMRARKKLHWASLMINILNSGSVKIKNYESRKTARRKARLFTPWEPREYVW